MPVFTAVGVFVVLTTLLPGNLLVLAPTLGAWAYSILAFSAKSGNARGHYGGKTRIPRRRWRLLTFTLVLWVGAIAIGSYRIAETPHAPSEELGRQMADAERLFRTGDPRVALKAFQAIDIPGAFLAR